MDLVIIAVFAVVWIAATIPIGILFGKVASTRPAISNEHPTAYVCPHGHTDSDACPVCCH